MIGNEISFDLRKYAGHPDFTVSVYLPMQMENLEEISKIIDHGIWASKNGSWLATGLGLQLRDRYPPS